MFNDTPIFSNNSIPPPDDAFYEFSFAEVIIWIVLYAIIAVFSVFGNILVMYVTIKRLRSRSITTYFIINLALADILTGVIAIPFKFQAALFQKWLLPPILCKLVPYTESVTLSVSVFTLTASAVHEFRTVFFPRHSRLSSNAARLLVFVIWLSAAFFSLPMGLFHEVIAMDEETNACWPTFIDDPLWKAYNIGMIIATYFIPMFILDTAYIMIAIKIWMTTSTLAEELQVVGDKNAVELGNRKQSCSRKSSRQLMKMLIIVVALFSLCWFPYETYMTVNELSDVIGNWYYVKPFFFMSHWLAMSNSCLNPIIYGLYNDKYNREYKRFFKNCKFWQWKKKADFYGTPENFSTEFPARTLIEKETSATPLTPGYTESFQVATISTGKPTPL